MSSISRQIILTQKLKFKINICKTQTSKDKLKGVLIECAL